MMVRLSYDKSTQANDSLNNNDCQLSETECSSDMMMLVDKNENMDIVVTVLRVLIILLYHLTRDVYNRMLCLFVIII